MCLIATVSVQLFINHDLSSQSYPHLKATLRAGGIFQCKVNNEKLSQVSGLVQKDVTRTQAHIFLVTSANTHVNVAHLNSSLIDNPMLCLCMTCASKG